MNIPLFRISEIKKKKSKVLKAQSAINFDFMEVVSLLRSYRLIVCVEMTVKLFLMKSLFKPCIEKKFKCSGGVMNISLVP